MKKETILSFKNSNKMLQLLFVIANSIVDYALCVEVLYFVCPESHTFQLRWMNLDFNIMREAGKHLSIHFLHNMHYSNNIFKSWFTVLFPSWAIKFHILFYKVFSLSGNPKQICKCQDLS